MYGAFGGYTRWAVVFLIIFVLFFLLIPAYGAVTGGAVAAGPGVAITSYHAATTMPMPGYQAKPGFGYHYMGGYEAESSS